MHPVLATIPRFIGRRVRISNRIYSYRAQALVGQLATVVDAAFYTNSGHVAWLDLQLSDGSLIREMKYHELDFIEGSDHA